MVVVLALNTFNRRLVRGGTTSTSLRWVDPTSTTIITTILVNREAVETMPRTKSTDELRNESRTMKRDIIQVMAVSDGGCDHVGAWQIQ
jgi:hypothetical protein